MTAFDRFDPFERRISDAIEEIAAARPPDYLTDVYRQTARTSQRPRWTFPERWLPVDAVSSVALVRSRPGRMALVLITLAALIVVGLALVGISPPVPNQPVLGVFERTGDLARVPAFPHVLRLRDGSILVADGRSLQRFHPATRAFMELPDTDYQIRGWIEDPNGDLITLRVEEGVAEERIAADRLPAPGVPGRPRTIAKSDDFHLQTSVALTDGRIVVLGQEFGVEALVALVFDPATATFTRGGGTPFIVNGEDATLLADGRILVIDQPIEAAHMNLAIYDVATRSFARLPSLPFAAMFSTTLLRDGRVLIAGGGVTPVGGSPVLTGSAYLVNPSDGTVVNVGPLPEARWMHAAALLADGRVLLAGGSVESAVGIPTRTTLYFDPATSAFSRGPDMLDARMNATPVALADGRVLFFGHSTLVQSTPSGAENSSELFR